MIVLTVEVALLRRNATPRFFTFLYKSVPVTTTWKLLVNSLTLNYIIVYTAFHLSLASQKHECLIVNIIFCFSFNGPRFVGPGVFDGI